MTKTKKQSLEKEKNNVLPRKVNIEKMIGIIIILGIIGSVVAIFSITLFPSPQEGFSEIILLTYNSADDTYSAGRYPFFIYISRNISIYFIVKNFENKVSYYQLQIKATRLSQNISTDVPLSNDLCYLMYSNSTYEKIISPATNTEKKDSGKLTGHYIWSPTNVTLFLNSHINLILQGESEVKIVFELWRFDTSKDEFQYSGVFTFLELDIRWS